MKKNKKVSHCSLTFGIIKKDHVLVEAINVLVINEPYGGGGSR